MADRYYELKKKVIHILKENEINTFDFVRIAKNLCTCQTCKYFIQHYDDNGEIVCFGHCIKNNAPRSKSPHQSACGFWDIIEN